MNITEEDFNARLSALAKENWKVKKLLENYGGFKEMPKHIQDLICEALKVKVTTITLTNYELTD